MANFDGIDDLLLQWEDARQVGLPLGVSDLCPRWPDGQAELRRRAELLCKFETAFGMHGPTPGSKAGQETTPAIPGCTIRGELGRGGMGMVYRAWQEDLNREVAVKVMRGGTNLAPNLTQRFALEARLLARLRHEHIVPVYEAKLHRGQPYFVMELVRGGSLASAVERYAGKPFAAARLMEQVARAVQHAHEQGVLHRDLKPENILLDEQGRPHVSDFGLAKLLGSGAEEAEGSETGVSGGAEGEHLTVSGAVMGTPPYMAPEQLDPTLGPMSPATDVWALGVILYELLTGQKPFAGASREELRVVVCGGTPARPRALQRRLERRLEAVVLRCLAKEPTKRFGSAGELADALARCGRPRRLVQWVAASLAGVALILGVIGLVTREIQPERRFERRVAPLLAQLQRGQAVDLIEPGGPAPAFVVRAGEGITKAHMTEEGFTVTSPAAGLVEFLPRLPAPPYRVEAEFRHDYTRFGPVGDSGVGVTFTGRHVSSPDGMQHVVGAVMIDDWGGRADDEGKRQNRARIQLIWYLDTPTDGRSPFKHHLCFPPNQAADYTWPAESEKSMHTLAIDVQPEGTSAFLGDAPQKILGPLRPDLFTWFADRLPAVHEEVRGVDLGSLNQPAVGVLVSGGQCTIRRLRIVPSGGAAP
jgi:hypothetical protein